MIVRGCRTSGSFPQEAMKLADGMATVGSRFYDNVIPVPLSVDDKVRSTSLLRMGSYLNSRGRASTWNSTGLRSSSRSFPGLGQAPNRRTQILRRRGAIPKRGEPKKRVG